LGDGFHRTGPGTGAAVYTFFGIYPAFPVLFGNCRLGTFSLTGAAIDTGVRNFVSHSIPLSISFSLNYYRGEKIARLNDLYRPGRSIMLFVGISFSLALLGVIVYIALSRKSSKALRLTALVALGAIILSVLICLVIIFAGMGAAGKEPVMPDFLTTEPLSDAPKGNFLVLFLLAVFIVTFLGIVILLSLRERKRQQNHSS
jgi:hypothetical protein